MGLVKQAYSTWMSDPRSSKQKKWHITAYFTQADVVGLPTPVEDPSLRTVAVPSGVYGSGKARTKDPELDAKAISRRGQQQGSSSHTPSYYHFSSAPRSASNLSRSAHYEGRRPEDQRLIQMLNSQHIL